MRWNDRHDAANDHGSERSHLDASNGRGLINSTVKCSWEYVRNTLTAGPVSLTFLTAQLLIQFWEIYGIRIKCWPSISVSSHLAICRIIIKIRDYRYLENYRLNLKIKNANEKAKVS